MNEPIISVSGLRGIIGQSLDPMLAARYATAFATKLGPGPIVVTRDGRATGPMLANAINAALAAAGRDVNFADVAATPTTGVLVRERSAAGGIQISASHNPPEYNGIKLFGDSGRVIPADQGEAVRQAYFDWRPSWVEHFKVGRIAPVSDTTSSHLAKVLATVDVAAIRDREFRVLLNSNHGAGSILAKALFEELNVRASFVGDTPDGLFDTLPEPTAANLTAFCEQARHGDFDVSFAQDPDADRLAVVDEQGRYIGEELTLAITLDQALRQQPGPVVINCATSKMSIDIAAQHGSTCHLSAVGEANVCDKMIEVNAVYGGEGNGGPIDPRVGYVRDSFVAMAQVLDSMTRQSRKVSEMVEELPRYAITKQAVNIDREKMPAAFEAIAERFSDGRLSRQDGLRLDWDDRWLLIRASNTEPIVRIIAEAGHQTDSQRLCEETQRILDSVN